MHAERERRAEAAVTALGTSPSEHARLQVHCARNHHVAVVYDTPDGLVYSARTLPHGHGERDRHDSPHKASVPGRPYRDLLDPGTGAGAADDDLPASCECGTRTLSRRLLLAAIAAGDRRIVID